MARAPGRRRVVASRPGTSRLTGVLAVVCAAVSVGSWLPADTPVTAARSGATFVVDSIADGGDGEIGDGICNTASFGRPAECTLRAAMEEAEAQPGHDTIEFAISGPGPHRIEPTTRLPAVEDPDGVTVDGYSAPGSQVNTLEHGTNARLTVEVRGGGPSSFDAFEVRSPGSTIRGLAIFDFARHIRIVGPDADENTVVGNFIGTDAAATFRQPVRVTNSNAVHLERGAERNRIGRIGNEHRNLFAGNADKGVAIYDAGTDANQIQNNVFGLTPSGDARLANWGHNIDINFSASDNIIGGFLPGTGNVVSGSELSGIEISHDVGPTSTSGNVVSRNLIGTTPDGSAGPLYAGNREFGVNLEGQARCSQDCGPDVSENVVMRNVIVGSRIDIMVWKGAVDNRISHNNIGVVVDGSRAEGSAATMWAVLIEAGASGNVVERNLIAGVDRGIHVKADNSYPADCSSFDVVCPSDASFDTSGNTFSKNSIDDIDLGLGIDLYEQAESGAFVSGPSAHPSPLVNGGIATPTIDAIDTDSMTARTCPGCTVELFVTSTPRCEQCWSDHGRGRAWVADGVADASGRVEIVFRSAATDRYVVAPGSSVAVHATDGDGNTSEHSLRAVVVAGSVVAPADTSIRTVEVGIGLVPEIEVRSITLANVFAHALRCAFSGFC